MLLQNPFPGAFGLDIGDQSIKLMRLRARSRPTLSHGISLHNYFEVEEIRTISVPSGYILNGEIVQHDSLRKLLLILLGKEGKRFRTINSPWVVANLPEPKTFLKLIQIDVTPELLNDEEVHTQARKHLPFELDEAYIDWEYIDMGVKQHRTNVLIGAVHKNISDSYTNLLETAGLQPVAMEIEALSIARAMVTRDKDYTGVARAILDLGATRSSLVIYDYNTIQFSTNISFSGRGLTQAIAVGMGLDLDSAEDLKVRNGLLYDSSNVKYLQIIMRETDNLVANIQNAVNFYKDHFHDANPITHITMCGGSANLKNLDKEISRRLKISAMPGNAWKNLNNRRFSEKDRQSGLSLSSAIGLALRAVESNY